MPTASVRCTRRRRRTGSGKNYFFRLSKYREALLKHFREHPLFLQPDNRRNEMLRLLESGLEDISVSRAGQLWGIPLPFAPDNVVYVWFDALINYAAAVGYAADETRFAEWWPADLHIVGKDITRFHTVVWPAMLMSAGLALPTQVFGHGWVNFGGQRMSKSLGTSLDPSDVAQRFGPDPLRLYLVKEISYGGDGDFTWERYEERYNVDLANNLGNLVSRVAAMADKYRGGRLTPAGGSGRLAEVATVAHARYRAAMDGLALHEGASAAFSSSTPPTSSSPKQPPGRWPGTRRTARASTTCCSRSRRQFAWRRYCCCPIMPASCAEILRRVGRTNSRRRRALRSGRSMAFRRGEGHRQGRLALAARRGQRWSGGSFRHRGCAGGPAPGRADPPRTGEHCGRETDRGWR